MTSTAKLQKDKMYGSTPRLAPRGTAASIARAARNATNRNTTSVTFQKSPSRNTTSSKPIPGCKSGLPQNEPVVVDKIIKSEINVSKTLSIEQMKNDEEHNAPARPEADLLEVCTNDVTESGTKEQLNNSGEEFVDTREDCKESAKIIDDKETVLQIDIESDTINTNPEYEKVEVEHTPVSRPQTPKSGQSSFSRSSRVQSRPATPVKPSNRPTTSISRPNTPRQSALPRPRASSALKPPMVAQKPPSHCQSEKTNHGHDDVAVIFSAKQKEFHSMKKELDLKQKAILETFNILKTLQDRMIKEGKIGQGEGLNQQELVIFNVADWAAEEVAQLCHHYDHATDGAGELINTFMSIDEDFLAKWDSKVLNIANNFADLCLHAFTTRQEVIDWVKVNITNQDEVSEDDLSRIAVYNKQGVELGNILRDFKIQADESLQGVTQLLKQTCQERSILITVGESLVKEIAHLRKHIELQTAAAIELSAHNAAESETAKALEDTRRELEEERAAKVVIKDKLSTTESQLRQTRTRVNKMDRQLREAEASIASLTSTVKSLEDQSRQKEVQLEARARKLKESLKTGEVTTHHLMQEREALQNELAQLKDQLERNVVENKATIQDLNNQLRDLKSTLESEGSNKCEEIKIRNMFEESYRESLNTIDELKAQIVELDRKKQNADLPTEKEMELRAELIATKETLRLAGEEMIACKREKVRFLETLTKIAESENKMGMQQKLASELHNKEEIMCKMQTQIRELTKSIKLNEQKVMQYEQYVRDMQMYNQASGNGQEISDGVTFQELQQEIMHLRMGLLEAVHRNEELTELLMQKDQQFEQLNKTSRAQAKVIKVREELINILKNKETEQTRDLSMLQQDLANRMKIVEEVNKQIASKAEEIQELFSTLENKQHQIHRLEKIVLALEEQQRRAQAQRTRHEEKIAVLEHELAAGGNRRERKFLFF